MKFKLRPVRLMKKGRTKVWVACDASCAQAYQILDKSGRVVAFRARVSMSFKYEG